MIYHPEDFQALSNAVEHEGGKLLSEECEGHEFMLDLPDTRGRMMPTRRWTTSCGFSALMEIPYDASLHVRLREDDSAEPEPVTIVDHSGEDFAGGPVKVCAVDDALGLWPRFAGVVSDRSYQT